MSNPIMVRDIMATGLLTLKPDMPIFQAIVLLLKNNLSGAPVLDDNGKLAGMLSEKDCLRVFANEAFFSETAGGPVSEYMTKDIQTIDADSEVFAAADVFFKNSFRKLPVLENGVLVGQLTRRDVLKASLRVVETSPKKKEWSDSRYIPEEIKTILNSSSTHS